jgi:nitroimidazol reductase NimA-like FMN-containing flavoprotein (pyridoxamine 5'-phosphate oxidase superfamily)
MAPEKGRPMRKQKNLVSDQAEKEAILQKALVLRVAMCCEGQPYVVPVSFGYSDGRLYFHTGPKGMKMDFLAANERVCFEVDTEMELLPANDPCEWSVRYKSVVGFGRARKVEDQDERLKALRLIMEHYAGPGEYDFPAPNLARTAVVCIEIQEMTGRRSGF